MAESPNSQSELDVLVDKVRRASELISRLKESNRALAVELERLEHQVQSQSGSSDRAPTEPTQTVSETVAPDPSVAQELGRLRRERLEIRERVSRLLERIESLDV